MFQERVCAEVLVVVYQSRMSVFDLLLKSEINELV